MSDVTPIRTPAESALIAAFPAARKSLPGNAHVIALREAAFNRFEAKGLPHRRVEEWKYTDLRTAMRDALSLAQAPQAATLAALGHVADPFAQLDAYRITIAVAGFSEDEIDLTAQQNLLVIRAKKAEVQTDPDAPREFLHRGIATRAFERRFQLADHVEVRGARLENGLLAIDLVREVPEAMKPRRIAIANSNVASLIDATDQDRKAA